MNENRIKKMKQTMIVKDGRALLPSRAIFYPTLRCNLSCKMCFQGKHTRNNEELSLEEIKEIFKGIRLSSILLVGGEIFVRKDIYEILSFFNTHVDNVLIQTNGTLIDDEGIEKLIKLKNINEIWISIDGLKETHDSIRGNGTFEKALNVIRKLTGKKKIVINTVILEENIDELLGIYEFFNNNCVNQITYQFQMIYTTENYKKTQEKLSKFGINCNMYSDCVSNNVDLTNSTKLKDMIPLLKNAKKETNILFYPKIFENKIEDYINGTVLMENQVVCRDIIDSVLKINAKGELVVCEALNYTAGDLKEKPLKDLWNSKEVTNIRQSLCSNNLVDLCSRCCCLDFKIV